MTTRTVRAVFEATSSPLEAGLRRSADAANRTADALSRVGRETSKLSGSGQAASSTLERMARSAEQNEQAWTRAGTAVTTFGAVTAAGLGLSAKAAVDWESAFAGVQKTVDDSAEGYAQLSDELRGMARDLPATHGEIAGVAEAAGQLGVAREDITGFTRTMVDLAETTNLTADEAATSIAQMTNVMQTAPQDVARLGSALVALGNDGASTERQIIQMSQRMAGAAATVGLAEYEVLALANTVASMGIEVEAGGTAVSRILIDMSKAAQTGSSELATFAEVAGMSAEEFATAFREDPAEAFATFISGLGEMQSAGEDVFTTLDDLGLADVRVSQALLGMASSGDLLTDSLELGAQAWAENTALADEAAQRYETTAARLEVMRNNIHDAGISLGSVFLPALAEGSEHVADLAEWLAQLPEPLQQIAAWGGASAATLGLVAGGFMLVTPRAVETYRAFQQLGIIGPRTSSAIRGVAGVLTGPWGLAIAGAVTAVGFFVAEQAKARAEAEALRGTLDEQTGAITENTRAWWAQNLSDRGILEDYEKMGGSVRDLTLAIEGDAAARQRIIRTVGDYAAANERAASSTGGLGVNLSDASTQSELFIQQLDALGVLTDEQAEKQRIAAAAAEGMARSQEALAAESARLTAQAEAYAAAQDGATGAVERFVPASERAFAAGDDAIEAFSKWRDELAGIDAGFVDFSGALGAVQSATQEWAQGQADATDTAEDSWEDFYDGQSVNVDKWIAELERMVAAQTDWETNMLILSGRVSQGVIDELARMGPEGAPLVAQLVDASDAELARLEAVYGERASDATGAYATALIDAGPVIRAAAARWGEDIAAEVAEKIAAGEMTAAEAVAMYDLAAEVNVTANTDPYGLGVGIALGQTEESSATSDVHADTDPYSTQVGIALGTTAQSTATSRVLADSDPYLDVLAAALGTTRQSVGTATIAGRNIPFLGALSTAIAAADRAYGEADLGLNTGGAFGSLRAFLNSIPSSVSVSLRAVPVVGGVASAMLSLAGGFDSGGYTGVGAKYEPAGVVHREEFVHTKENTSKPGMLQFHTDLWRTNNLDEAYLRHKLRGYADGGPVAQAPRYYPYAPPVSPAAAAPAFSLDGTRVVLEVAGRPIEGVLRQVADSRISAYQGEQDYYERAAR